MVAHQFQAKLEIIGINPFVFVPEVILEAIFQEAGKKKGPIPVKGKINGEPYTQTLMKFKGEWRLYVNGKMLKNSPKRIGEVVEWTITYDATKRTVLPHPKFTQALLENKEAKKVFEKLSPSRQLEIVRYIAHLKKEESVDKNIVKAIDFLQGKGRFVGREKP